MQRTERVQVSAAERFAARPHPGQRGGTGCGRTHPIQHSGGSGRTSKRPAHPLGWSRGAGPYRVRYIVRVRSYPATSRPNSPAGVPRAYSAPRTTAGQRCTPNVFPSDCRGPWAQISSAPSLLQHCMAARQQHCGIPGCAGEARLRPGMFRQQFRQRFQISPDGPCLGPLHKGVCQPTEDAT